LRFAPPAFAGSRASYGHLPVQARSRAPGRLLHRNRGDHA